MLAVVMGTSWHPRLFGSLIRLWENCACRGFIKVLIALRVPVGILMVQVIISAERCSSEQCLGMPCTIHVMNEGHALMVQEEAGAIPSGSNESGLPAPSAPVPEGELLTDSEDELPAWAQADIGPEQELASPVALEGVPPALDAGEASAVAEPMHASSEDQQQQDEGPMHQDVGGQLPACAQSRAHAEAQTEVKMSASQVSAFLSCHVCDDMTAVVQPELDERLGSENHML